MRDCYIPDLTERFPEGLDGPDMFEPRDPEYEFWCAVEKADREYWDSRGEELWTADID